MSIPTDLKYTSDHEWIRLDGDVATVGITAFAAEALGDVVAVAPRLHEPRGRHRRGTHRRAEPRQFIAGRHVPEGCGQGGKDADGLQCFPQWCSR